MLIVGTDRMRVLGTAAAPDGTRHAVDLDGRVLCRASRARYTWPALSWEEQQAEEAICSLCVQVRTAQEALSQAPAYPIGSVAEVATAAAIVPWQISAGLFENEQA
jgi:hypothetical protein